MVEDDVKLIEFEVSEEIEANMTARAESMGLMVDEYLSCIVEQYLIGILEFEE